MPEDIERIRQPIVSVLGHVDHGKTTFLDYIRGTKVAKKEAGGITQHIGATEVPINAIMEFCGPMLGKANIKLPGLLFIDTPGHEAFTTLRRRGSALADLAVLVIDINEGVKPQTKESLMILKQTKTPFIIMANKIDRINGWEIHEGKSFLESSKMQSEEVVGVLDTMIYDLIGQVYDETGISADRYDRISDFTKTVAIVPASARYGVGVADTLMILVGLAQRFLEESLHTTLSTTTSRGTVLEVKEVRGLGKSIDTIIYDGQIHAGDTLLVGTMNDIKVTKVRALLKPKPLDEIRDPKDRFDTVKSVDAAAGIKILAQDLEGVLAGMPMASTSDESLVDDLLEELKSEVEIDLQTSPEGVYVKTDAIGSLEAIVNILAEKGIAISGFGIGDISKRDIIEAETITDPTRRVILAFNVQVMPEAKEYADQSDITILEERVIYKLIENYEEWLELKKRELESENRKEVVHPGMFKILPDYIFRVSNPAIVGVRVLAGRIRAGQSVLREDGRIVGRIRSIQKDKDSIKEAVAGDEVAVSIDGPTVGRQIDREDILYIDIPEGDAKLLFNEMKGNLNADEMDVLEKVARIKRKIEPFWGMA